MNIFDYFDKEIAPLAFVTTIEERLHQELVDVTPCAFCHELLDPCDAYFDVTEPLKAWCTREHLLAWESLQDDTRPTVK